MPMSSFAGKGVPSTSRPGRRRGRMIYLKLAAITVAELWHGVERAVERYIQGSTALLDMLGEMPVMEEPLSEAALSSSKKSEFESGDCLWDVENKTGTASIVQPILVAQAFGSVSCSIWARPRSLARFFRNTLTARTSSMLT